MRTLLTQTFCLVCNTQNLYLYNNKIGDAGCTALAKAAAGGAPMADVCPVRRMPP